ncbi:MAG: cobalamin biosynthesis protein CobD [Epsilonproteobacteria bacterium]|nr:cobalamin biosynthesis protein CobD [Campylobacterota bacterium]
MYFDIALIAYTIDRVFGEFRFIRHPVVLMGDYIKWFEKRFYKDNIFRGALLTLSLTSIVGAVGCCCHSTFAYIFPEYISAIILGIIASTTIASKMLYDSVKDIVNHPENIRFLVSRDTENLSTSNINKAAIETYAENLSDGVIAQLFYLILFGLWGAFVYKAINTLDSMVGYKNKRYEKFGKFSARLDDVVNYVPARITALLIIILFRRGNPFWLPFKQGKLHDSPNAGHPIAAMALSLGIKLGGDTSYFGKIKSKPFFGIGRENITKDDIQNALNLQPRLDIFILLFLGLGVVL